MLCIHAWLNHNLCNSTAGFHHMAMRRFTITIIARLVNNNLHTFKTFIKHIVTSYIFYTTPKYFLKNSVFIRVIVF